MSIIRQVGDDVRRHLPSPLLQKSMRAFIPGASLFVLHSRGRYNRDEPQIWRRDMKRIDCRVAVMLLLGAAGVQPILAAQKPNVADEPERKRSLALI